MGDWTTRVAIVTGASSGIGLAAARRIVEQGGSVVLVDQREPDPGAISSRNSAADRVRTVVGDVTAPLTYATAIVAAEKLGGLNAMLLNAGMVASGSIESLDMDTFDRVIGVNLRSVVLGVRAGLPLLRKASGPAIAVTASVSGLGGDPGMWAYNTAKGGVVNFVRAAALELGGMGIRVNAVCPGPTHTGMTLGIQQSPIHEELRRHIPLGRWGEPEKSPRFSHF